MDLIERYLRYVEHIKRYSDKTVNTYGAVLGEFMRHAFSDREDAPTDEEMLQALTPGMIRGYEVHLMEDRGLNARTVNLHISVLSGFCRFLMKESLLTSNPARTVTRPKTAKRLPTTFRQSALESYFMDTDIFAAPPEDAAPEEFIRRYRESRPKGYRENADETMQTMLSLEKNPEDFRLWLYGKRLRRVLIMTLYCTGIRRAELVSLNRGDLDSGRMTMRIRGKGDKMREIPVTCSLYEEISLYLQAVEMICGKEDRDQALFVTVRGRRIYPEYVDRAVKAELGEAEGFTGRKSPHVLRHTLATELLDSGTDLYSIKELLGHSSLAATQVYTHNSIEKLRKVYQTAHPRAKNGGENGD